MVAIDGGLIVFLFNFIRKYWIEIITIGLITTGIMICVNPDFTWINTDSDGIHYTYAARWLYPSHKTSSPLYVLLGWVFIHGIPFGTDAWRMALIGAVSVPITCVFIYKAIVRNVNNRVYGIIGMLVYGTSAIVISQATIVDTYAFDTMLMVGSYYYCITGKWKTASVFIGMGIATHLLTFAATIPLVVKYKELRNNWKTITIALMFMAFYLYIPLTNRPPYMWQPDPNINNNGTLLDIVNDVYSTIMMLSGGLSIWDLPKRILDTVGLELVCYGFSLIPITIWMKHSDWKDELLWMFIIPTVYFIIDLSPQTYVYIIPSVAFGGIGFAYGMKWLGKNTEHVVVMCMVWICIMLGVYNFVNMDIGRTLDKNMSASNFYYNELNKIPDGQILMPNYDWEWTAVFRYNKEFGRNIVPVDISMLPSEVYRKQIAINEGVNFDTTIDNKTVIIEEQMVAKSIMDNNVGNIWTTESTDPETYGSKVVKLENVEQLNVVNGYKNIEPTWKWKPSNPYDMITGSIEVSEWNWIIWSNYSCLTIIMMGACGLIPMWIAWNLIVKRKKFVLLKR